MVEPSLSPQQKIAAWQVECPEALVPGRAFERLSRAAARVPASTTGFFAECHLDHPNRTDLIARVHRWDRDRLIEHGAVPARLARFVEWWVTRADPEGAVLAMDLEWDLVDETMDFFVCPLFEPELSRGHFRIHERDAARRARGLGSLALDLGPEQLLALDPDVPGAALAQLRRGADQLPPYSVLIPGWPGRTRPNSVDRGIRVIISLPQVTARAYLSRLGWTADLDAFERAAELLCDGQTWIGFDADFSEAGIGPRLALYREVFWARAGDTELMTTLERIRESGLCRPERLDGLHAWLVRREAANNDQAARRSLSLKLVLDGAKVPVIKAYVSGFDELHALGIANAGASE